MNPVANRVAKVGPSSSRREAGFRLKLPATSANLGPGFDSLALAMALYLEIEATTADAYVVAAAGRNQDVCSLVEGNLLFSVYRQTVQRYTKREPVPLALAMHNGIPLGMGCGSSAASRLAGVALAAHFGGLGWSRQRILDEASHLEGHPDNAAACWLGGFVASGWDEPASGTRPGDTGNGEFGDGTATQPGPGIRPVAAISITPPPAWRALLVLPERPLATTVSRAVLPEQYSRRDTVANLQRVAVLTAAFAAGRGELLAAATGDCLHQPYRGEVCPLLLPLLPLAGKHGILSVTLSGAGPGILLLLESAANVTAATLLVREALSTAPGNMLAHVELLDCALVVEPAYAAGCDDAAFALPHHPKVLVTKNY